MQKILGIGNSLVDILAKVSQDVVLNEMNLPKGSMQLIDSGELAIISQRMRHFEHTRASGGSAANTMKALSHVGVEAGFIGKIASDEFGMFFNTEIENAGIHSSLIRKSSGSTGIASTFITPDGQRTFATYLGVSAELSEEDITPELLSGYEILYVEGYLVQNHRMIEHTMELAKRLKMTICLDLASYNIVENDREFFHTLLARYVDIVFANEEEGRDFTGKGPDEAAQELSRLCHIAIVKKGAQGACVASGNEWQAVPAEKVDKVLDTTGAGDYFSAGFLYGYVHNMSLKDSIRVGGILSGEIIRVIGTTLHTADWQRILERISTLQNN